MDLTKKWHRSEFVSHEMLEVHRGIECELDFYSAIANGEIELVQENCNEQAFTNYGCASQYPISLCCNRSAYYTFLCARRAGTGKSI